MSTAERELEHIFADEQSNLPVKIVTAHDLQKAEHAELLRRSRLKVLISKMLDGSLPTGRPVRSGEVMKFSTQHVNCLLDYAAGAKIPQLSEQYGWTPKHTSSIINHPYAEIFLSELASAAAEKTLDPMSRIRAVAGEMINTKLEIVRDPETPKHLRNSIASDMLDRAGLGAVHKSETTGRVLHIPAAFAARLVAGLNEENKVGDLDYSRHLMQPGEPLEGGVLDDPTPSAGHTEESLGASPETPSAEPEAA